jgi:hypothetical protein
VRRALNRYASAPQLVQHCYVLIARPQPLDYEGLLHATIACAPIAVVGAPAFGRYAMPTPTERGPLGDLSGRTASLVAILISALFIFVVAFACVALLPT